MKRHFVAQWRQQQRRQLDHFSKPGHDDADDDVDARKEVDGDVAASAVPTHNDANPADKKSPQRPFSTPATMTSAAQGLARLGSRTALSFAFAFLRRAWRSGEDADLCSDLLQVWSQSSLLFTYGHCHVFGPNDAAMLNLILLLLSQNYCPSFVHCQNHS